MRVTAIVHKRVIRAKSHLKKYEKFIQQISRTPNVDLTEALANALGVSPLTLEVPNIDSYLGVIHTLFALQDLYGLTVDNKDGELAFRIAPRKGKDAANILEMIRSWALLAEKYRAGEITKDDQDKWRYNYPQYDAAEIWAHVPSQELSDALVESFQEKLRNE